MAIQSLRVFTLCTGGDEHGAHNVQGRAGCIDIHHRAH